MAREVITKIWCDVCMEEEKLVDAQETPAITIGNWKPRVLALCEVHMKEVYEPIRELLQELGQILPEQASPGTMARMPGTSPGSGIYPCLDPDCPKFAKPFKHEQSLRNHIRRVHKMSVTEMKQRFGGEVSPDDMAALFDDVEEIPDEKPPAVLEATCDQDGCDIVYAYPEYKRPAQAMGVHKAKTHGIRGATKAKKLTTA